MQFFALKFFAAIGANVFSGLHVQLYVLRLRHYLQVRYVVVGRVAVNVMDNETFRNFAIEVFPNSPVEKFSVRRHVPTVFLESVTFSVEPNVFFGGNIVRRRGFIAHAQTTFHIDKLRMRF